MNRNYDAITITEDGQLLLKKAETDQVATVWDRYQAQLPVFDGIVIAYKTDGQRFVFGEEFIVRIEHREIALHNIEPTLFYHQQFL